MKKVIMIGLIASSFTACNPKPTCDYQPYAPWCIVTDGHKYYVRCGPQFLTTDLFGEINLHYPSVMEPRDFSDTCTAKGYLKKFLDDDKPSHRFDSLNCIH